MCNNLGILLCKKLLLNGICQASARSKEDHDTETRLLSRVISADSQIRLRRFSRSVRDICEAGRLDETPSFDPSVYLVRSPGSKVRIYLGSYFVVMVKEL